MLRVSDVCHTKFDVVLSLHYEGKWRLVWLYIAFLCKFDLSGKH